RRHRAHKAVVFEALFEIPEDLVRLLRRGVDGDRVVVVKVHAIRADLAEQIANLLNADLGSSRLAKRVAANVADGPKAERELHFGIGIEAGHRKSPLFFCMQIGRRVSSKAKYESS